MAGQGFELLCPSLTRDAASAAALGAIYDDGQGCPSLTRDAASAAATTLEDAVITDECPSLTRDAASAATIRTRAAPCRAIPLASHTGGGIFNWATLSDVSRARQRPLASVAVNCATKSSLPNSQLPDWDSNS